MELVSGISLTSHCDEHKLTTKERLELFIPICEAIQHAHQKGVIYRDLKPSNVIVEIQEDIAVPKVIDFGIAKATEQRLTERTLFTKQGQFIGTPEYMSPEQADMSDIDVDTRTDIYSLGVMLYELLVGALPFDPEALRSAGFGEIHRIIREEEPPRASTRLSELGDTQTSIVEQRRTDITPLRKELKGDLDWITMRAMEKDRTRRYKAAIGFALLIQGDYKEAETHIREGLVIREKLLGREHIQVAPSIENLTRSALSISQNALGDSHNFSTVYLMNLARLKLHLRDYDEARGLYREVLKKYQQGSDRQRMLIPRILRRLAKISKIREEHEQAEELLREALTELSEQGRSKTTQYAGTLFEIAELLSRKGKKDEAKKLYSEAFKVQQRYLEVLIERTPQDLITISLGESLLGGCLKGLERFEEAEPILIHSYPEIKKSRGRITSTPLMPFFELSVCMMNGPNQIKHLSIGRYWRIIGRAIDPVR